MKYERYPTRDAIRNYFPMPNEIFSLGLSTGEIATYAYLMKCENASFTLDTYTHMTTEMQKKASGIVGNFLDEIM